MLITWSLCEPKMQDFYARRYRLQEPLADVPREDVQRFLVSSAHVFNENLFRYLVSSYAIARYDAINEIVDRSHSMASRVLGVPALFSYPARRGSLKPNFADAVFDFLTDPSETASDRLTFSECLLSQAKINYSRHHVAITLNLKKLLKDNALPLVLRDGLFESAVGQVIEERVHDLFWALLADEVWKNVRDDMNHALSANSTGGKDSAFYAGRALESAVKIACEMTGRSTGREKGAAAFVDSLVRKDNLRFIDPWEADVLKNFFSNIRNPTAHGPGSKERLSLSSSQEEWIVEFCMIWVKSLVARIR